MNIVKLLRDAAKSLKKTPTSDHLEMQMEAAADELEAKADLTEKAANNQKELDMLLHGVSFSKDGKRIAPRDVYILQEGGSPVTDAVQEKQS